MLTGLIITQLTDNRKSGKGGIFLADGFYEVVENYFKSSPSAPTIGITDGERQFTITEILKELDECEHIDDAKSFFINTTIGQHKGKECSRCGGKGCLTSTIKMNG